MQRKPLAVLIAGLCAVPAPARAEDGFQVDEIVVTATRIPTPDVLAPFASEVHTRAMIDDSGASTLYDYLSHHTSLQVSPSYGNRFAPRLDMRGYGIGDGYQNIVVTVDGRRLNNIDMTAPLLGAIALDDVERIEITKGSGSVMFGDGATAGSIQIYTRAHRGVSVRAEAGNHGQHAVAAAAGMATDVVSLSASADYAGSDGFGQAAPDGHTDAASDRNLRGALVITPSERLRVTADLASTHIDARYPSPLTMAQFRADPSQVGSNPWVAPANAYTHQAFDTDTWGVGAELELAAGWRLSFRHDGEDKLSDYVSYGSRYDYAYGQNDLALRYQGNKVDLAAGLQSFDGSRRGSSDRTSKDNAGGYLQGQYHWDAVTVSAGARRERVAYTYQPDGGAANRAEHRLAGWDMGLNQQLSERLSWFANLDRAFQAPDIDRFFDWGGTFNSFIAPATSRTLNLGLNHVTPGNRLKLTVFRANLDNEIYYYSIGPWSGYNTNLDKTHKYGLEVQESSRIGEALGVGLIYAYTRAVIDREDAGAGAFDGKDLPGVPRHAVTLNVDYRFTPRTDVQVTHVWRSPAWAETDFANSNSQRQPAYQSTDVVLRHRRGSLEWFAAVDNLFAHKNGLLVDDDAIYPVNFTRAWRLGMKASF